MKKEIFQTKSRKLKKRNWQKGITKQINLTNCLKYNLFIYFIWKEGLQLNKKVLAKIFISETGTLLSLKKWILEFYNI